MKKVTLVFVLLAAFGQWVFGQKIEVEKKISEQDFPAIAIEWLNGEFQNRKCNRYYLESDGDSTNYEAKFKWQKACYSVEFFNDGELKDIEKQVKFSELPADLTTRITEKFSQDFIKYKVKKVQDQTLPGKPGHRYEIEVKGKNTEGTAYYEYLFEADGSLVERRKIILPPNNITLY